MMEQEQLYDQELLKDHDQKLVLTRKRTKRQRPISPLVLTMATTTSSCSTGSGGDGGFCDLQLSCGGGDRFSGSTSNNSGEFIQSKVDEEDMANCLILLAQGRRHQDQSSATELAGINGDAKTVPDVYECKTCNRRFHSFQALGGHRASHRKPKLVLSEEKMAENSKFSNTSLSSQVYKSKDSCSNNNNKSRVHECLICGAEFTSGQALGGHMRRHRPLPAAGAGARSITPDDTQEAKKSRLELLGLDLNLPAPEDDQPRGSKFSFASKDQVPVFATSQLVHCHY